MATGPADPIYRRPDWRAAVTHWRTGPGRHQPCARCGKAIDRRPRATGPWALDVGHIVSVLTGRAAGWTDAMLNALTNTQPEHRRCNRQHGARLGNRTRTTVPRPRPADAGPSRTW